MRQDTILKIRKFNRFYSPTWDLLSNRYLGSDYSATETRVIYEVYANSGCNAAYITRVLNIDKSYLSRIIKKFEKNGYLTRKVSEHDSRAYDLYLTDKGKELAEDFIQKSNAQVEELIKPLNNQECEELINALRTAHTILAKCRGME